MATNRISKIRIMEMLKKYLDDQLAWRIFNDMETAEETDERNQVGMKYGEWNQKFDDERELVWAADSHGGFGKKGEPVYGTADELTIVRMDTHMNGKKTLHLWDTDLWGWDDLKNA